VELNWTTFVLEIINFLVLMWILQRFLYKPVLAVIARRRAGIEQSLDDARQMRAEARELQQKYEGRLSDWEQERQQARAKLQQEIEAERTRLQKELETALSAERKKAEVAEQRRLQDSLRKGEETALQHGAQFATSLLQAAAGPELEARLLELLLSELQQLPQERLATLRAGWAEPAEIHVSSAFPLNNDQRQRLQQALAETTQLDAPLQFAEDAALLAGLRITIGAWVLGVNLRDELKSFAELGPVNSI
jgi:F-type H+-transporting ATPase subunit b